MCFRTQKYRNMPLRYSGKCWSRKKLSCRYTLTLQQITQNWNPARFLLCIYKDPSVQLCYLITRRDQFTSQDLMEEQSKNPSPSLEERIESAKRRAHQVRVKIQQDLVRRRHWIVNILKALYTNSKLFTSIDHRKWFSSISERFLSDIRPRSDEELK